jgi:Flp pilus assembly protein TadB
MWALSGILVIVWFVLKFLLHKGGFVHILLLGAISIFVVQLLAYRKTRYQRLSSGR